MIPASLGLFMLLFHVLLQLATSDVGGMRGLRKIRSGGQDKDGRSWVDLYPIERGFYFFMFISAAGGGLLIAVGLLTVLAQEGG